MRVLLLVCLVSTAAAQERARLDLAKISAQLDRGEYRTAIPLLRADFEENLRQYGPSAGPTLDAHYLLAFALVEAGQYQEGLELSKKLLDLVRGGASESDIREAELIYATALRATGNPEESAKVLKKTIERGNSGRHWRVLNQLAISYTASGKTKDAMDAATLALGRAPDKPRVRAHLTLTLAQLHLARGDWRKAEEAVQRAVEIAGAEWTPMHPEMAIVHGTRGAAYLRMNHPEIAETELRKALVIAEGLFGPDHSEVAPLLAHLAEAVRKNGRKPEAVELVKRTEEIQRRTAATVSVWSLKGRD